MPQVCDVGIVLVLRAPDFCEQLGSCFVALEDRSFVPTLHSQLLRARGRWHQFVYPWMLFWEERGLCASMFPPGQKPGVGEGGYSVSFYCFSIFLALWEDSSSTFQVWNLTTTKMTFSTLLLIIISRQNSLSKKNLSRKEISRNVIWLPENFTWYLMDAVPRGGSVGENQKNISLHMVFCATETHPPHIQPHALLHYWSITIQGCPCWVKTIHLQ